MNRNLSKCVLTRLAWPTDLGRLENFLHQTDSWMLQPLSRRVAIPALAEKILHHGNVIFSLDERAGECGVAAFYANNHTTRMGFITLLSVHPQFRGRGLGRQLLDHALVEMQTAGMQRARLQVAVTNHPAIRLYSTAGFHQLPVQSGDSPGYLFMEQALTLAPKPTDPIPPS